MSNEKWYQQIYEPYLETWKILNLIQYGYKHLSDPEQDKANDEIWNKYMRECDRLKAKYPDNEFVDALLNFIIGVGVKGAAEIIAEMNQKEIDE